MSLRVGAISPVTSYSGVSSVRQLSYSIDNFVNLDTDSFDTLSTSTISLTLISHK